jgi:hypothetical protein
MVIIPVSIATHLWWQKFYLSILDEVSLSSWCNLSADGKIFIINDALEQYHATYDMYTSAVSFVSEEHFTWFLLRWS